MNSCLNCSKPVVNKYCNTSCQNTHQNSTRANKRYGEFKSHLVKCNKCKKEFQVEEREKLFPQKEIYYCSLSCANSREHSEETKRQIGLSLLKERVIVKNDKILILKSKEPNHICLNCQKEFYAKPSKMGKFCSKSCTATYRMKNGLASILGKKSVSAQSKFKRSKNEIYFGELCQQKFNLVRFNEPIFSGWDADVIIEDLKLAVMWNGAWHYKKITKQHSVEQVQNRDRIKLKEIEKAGYKFYIIRDMGKYNKLFVEKEFKNFLDYLKL